ncbi:uncharacterized protein ACA1_074400 [Acanthamoeba castellanii str. Neff]|uniref:Peptidase C39-like domain-containing protein n=1 Tax=Acanthamoeba castellanii (strain ATCC 30010 / Neff) TaxID=1257118 RepID=L8HGM7_ACACF|nr:uncharacterized protein ACA1_074400 [Acanthamoeba castellanii str. Neff]ELR23873.1 hypothetical protein ACA1_074400 [Acanthamoeba castellanii str. Neff]
MRQSLVLVAVFLLGCLSLPLSVVGIPEAHRIKNVPYHRQLTEYSCGAASFGMAMGHATGEELDQRAIMDVLRTSEALGTFSGDMVRGGQFSHMSGAQGRQFPEQAPTRGWDCKRWPDQLGLGAFGHRRMTCWLDELKAAIAQDIPAIILMELGDVPFDGHYRVLVGYDDRSRRVTLLDPWDRDGVPREVEYSYEVFCGLWAYVERLANATYPPNFAAIVAPWRIQIEQHKEGNNLATMVASITYTCPEPFCPVTAGEKAVAAFVATNVTARITLPPNLPLSKGSLTLDLGTLQPGSTVQAKWQVTRIPFAKTGPVVVDAWGLISGSLPAVPKLNSSTSHYPAYTYVDAIGGSGTLSLF